MRIGQLLAISIVSISWSMPVVSQTLDTVSAPAELPPAGFTGSQFVDSRGCVFIRAGYDGRERWVPRVLRSKKVVCGFKPSFDPSQTRTRDQVAQSNQNTPVQITLDGPATPAAAPTTAVATSPVSPPVTTVPVATTRQIVRAPAPVVTRPAGPELVRGSIGVTQPPAGYVTAWDDDRLNPKRGLPKARGIAASDTRWTRDVPRQAVNANNQIDPASRSDVLVYPFTDLDQQNRFLAAQDRLKLVVRADGSIVMEPASNTATLRVSSKGKATVRATQSAGRTGQYIQVGAFGSPANSRRAADRIASLGLPAATSKSQRLTVVMAGPFTSHTSAKNALARLRQSGFSDAFVR